MFKVKYPRYFWEYVSFHRQKRYREQCWLKVTSRPRPPKAVSKPPVFAYSRIPHKREELYLKTGCWLYKYESPLGELLYVGVTDNLCGRVYQHMVSAWGHPAFGNKVFAAKFDNMRSARAVESFYLINHKPKLYLSPEKMTLGVPLGFEIPPVVFEEITHLIYANSP